MLIYSSFSTIIWVSLLIINFNIKTFWRFYGRFFKDKDLHNFSITKYKIFHVIGWGVPLIFTLICIFLNSIAYEYSNLCLISLNWIFSLFFWPLAIIIFPSFLLHIISMFYICYSSVKQVFVYENNFNKEVINDYYNLIIVFKNYWRFFFIGIISISTVTFYWIFYFTQITRINDLINNIDIIKHWLRCMTLNNSDQNKCVYILKDKVPSLKIMIAAETTVSIIGIWLFLIFGNQIYNLKKKMEDKQFLNLT